MDLRKLEGSMSGKFDVESTGRSIDDMMKSLSGRAEFSLANGTLSGVNMSTILKRIETRPLSVIRDMRGGKTDFETMRISTHITNGIANIDDSEMVFTPNTMKLSGSVSVGERQINLSGEATGPTPQNGAEPAVLAYTVTGGFDDPVVTPDINRILKRSSGAAASPD
jgi:AsmA protein